MTGDLRIEDLPILKSPHVHIKDEAKLMKIINKIVEDGGNALQIVTDFDLTLTKQHVDGKPILSSFGIFRKCKQLPPHYDTEAKMLYDKYRPMELDPYLSLEAKIAAMEEWCVAADRLLRDFEFDVQELDEAAQKYGTDLRDDTKELIQKLCDIKVPVLVFSAGLGDMVEAVLRLHGVLLENVKVISNFLKFEGNKLAGFKNAPLIHVYNKNEHALREDYFKILEGRHNVLLMGDSLGDASMADGIDENHNVLKIGFLYDRAEESLPKFKEAFDIVLIDDQTMQVPSAILNPIL